MQPIVSTQSKGSILHNYAYETYTNQKYKNNSHHYRQDQRGTAFRGDHERSQDNIIRNKKTSKIRIQESKRSITSKGGLQNIVTNSYENTPKQLQQNVGINILPSVHRQKSKAFSNNKKSQNLLGVSHVTIIDKNAERNYKQEQILKSTFDSKLQTKLAVTSSEFGFDQIRDSHQPQNLIVNKKQNIDYNSLNQSRKSVSLQRGNGALQAQHDSNNAPLGSLKHSIQYFDGFTPSNGLPQGVKQANIPTYYQTAGQKNLPKVKRDLSSQKHQRKIQQKNSEMLQKTQHYDRVLAKRFYDSSDPQKTHIFGNPNEVDISMNNSLLVSTSQSPVPKQRKNLGKLSQSIQFTEKKQPRLLREMLSQGMNNQTVLVTHDDGFESFYDSRKQSYKNMETDEQSSQDKVIRVTDQSNQHQVEDNLAQKTMTASQRKLLKKSVVDEAIYKNRQRLLTKTPDNQAVGKQVDRGVLEYQERVPRTALGKQMNNSFLARNSASLAGVNDMLSIKKQSFSSAATKQDQKIIPEVYKGAFELSRHEHAMQSKLQSHLKHRNQLVNAAARDTQSRLSSSHQPSMGSVQKERLSHAAQRTQTADQKAREEKQIEQELKRLQRSTIKVGYPKTLTNANADMAIGSYSPMKPSPFYNPKYFDQRFDSMGNFKPDKEVYASPMSRNAKNNKSMKGSNGGGSVENGGSVGSPHGNRNGEIGQMKHLDVNQRSRSTTQNNKLRKPRSKDNAMEQNRSTEQIAAQTSNPHQKQPSRGNHSKGQTDAIEATVSESAQQVRHLTEEKRSMIIARQQDKERELLYSWAPGTQKKKVSKKFDRMLNRFTNPENRHDEKRKLRKEEDNAKYWDLLAQNHAQSAMNMQRLERRLIKAEADDAKNRQKKELGLEKAKDIVNDEEESSEYHTSNSDQLSDLDEEEKRQNELDQIFDMNEIEIHRMLAEAVASKGNNMGDAQQNLFDENKPVQMTEKQRIRSLLMIQLFFAGLGDPQAIPLKDQLQIANRVREDHTNTVKTRIKAEKEEKRQARMEAKKQRMQGILPQAGDTWESDSQDSQYSQKKRFQIKEEEKGQEDSDEIFDEDDDDDGNQTDRENRIRERKERKHREEIKINTNTEIQQESKAKRLKLDEAVRKILLFKDMRTTDNKGDMNPDTKINQIFIRETIQQYSGAITAPSNIVSRRLVLPGYFLNEGVCSSLNNYLGNLTFDQLQVIDLKENGLKDSGGALLLSSITNQRALKQLAYSENEMGPLMADEISKILLWPNPTNLEKLTINNVKTTNYAVAVVLSALKNNRKLQALDLEQIQLNNFKNFDYLCQFLKSNKSVKNLRLSWASFMPQQIVDVMNLIKRRKSIEYLDLSENNLAPNPNNKQLVKQFTKTMRRFILRSSIFHLNISSMSLGKTIGDLAPAIEKSSTLNCIHMSNNAIPLKHIDKMDKKFCVPESYTHKVKAFRPFEVKKQQFTRMSSEETDRKGNDSDQEPLRKEKTLKEDLIGELKRIKDEKTQKVNANQSNKVNIKTSVAPLMQQPLIYHRILNHPEFVFPTHFMAKKNISPQLNAKSQSVMDQMISNKMKGMGGFSLFNQNQGNFANLEDRQDSAYFHQDYANKWKKIEPMTQKQIKKGKKGNQPDFSGVLGREGLVNTHHETCWVCEKRKYVLMVVNMDPGHDKKTWGVPITNELEKAKLKKKYLPNEQLPGNLNDYPIFVSSLNDWFPVHLMPCLQQSMMFDYQLMQDIARDSAKNISTSDSVQKFRQGYEIVINDVQNVKKMESFMTRIYKDEWRNYILKNLIYPYDTLFIDFPAPDADVDPSQLFIFTGFVKPGKHRSLLYDCEEDIWYKRDFYVDEREGDLPQFATYENTTAEKETHMSSIMKEWKQDNDTTIRKCVEHDEEFWKIGNTQFIKDPQDYKNLRALIVQHFIVLKDLFIHTAATDKQMTIGIFCLEELSKHMQLTDGKVTKNETVDRMFIAANVSDKAEEKQNPVNALIRYEFIEFLVRMAKFKYKEQGLAHTTSASFEKLINEILLPYHKDHCQEWQALRIKYFHKNSIDNLMHANKKSLENVFIKMATGQHQSKYFTPFHGLELARHLNLNLSEHMVLFSFYMCQITVDKEALKANQYEKINFIEFVEFVCRILYQKFKADSEANLIGAGVVNENSEANGSLPISLQSSQMNSQRARAAPKDEEQQKQAHEKHIHAFKEWCCTILDPFFDSQGLEFIDPDEDVALSDSAESEFIDDAGSGYNSLDPDNPEIITVMSSGNSSVSEEEKNDEIDFQTGQILSMNTQSRMSINSLGSKIKSVMGTSNQLAVAPEQLKKKVRLQSAAKKRQKLLTGGTMYEEEDEDK